jgi:hypothetical protein
MRILFVTHYFKPEGNAPATRVYEMTRRWAAAGHDVTVLTGVPNVPSGIIYDGYRNRRIQEEMLEGVRTVRVWTYIAANKGVVRRIMNYVSFMVSAILGSLRLGRFDCVIATSPQFFCGWAGVWISRIKHCPLVLEVRDIWPESIVAVGALRSQRLIIFLEWLERRMYAAADTIVTVGEGYVRKLLERGVVRGKIHVIPNGVDAEQMRGGDEGRIRQMFELGDRFVCAYIGTIGMACGLHVALEAGQLLKDKGVDDIVFLLVGDGAVRRELEEQARACGLNNVVFTGRLDKEDIPDCLAAADVCLVHLRRCELFKTVMPSKIFEAAAASKPVILGVEGEAAIVVREHEAGVCIEPENAGELVEAVCALKENNERREALGENGASRIVPAYSYDALAKRYLSFIEGKVFS